MSLIKTAKELRRQADLIESIATEPEVDPLDIAYLAIGAATLWGEYRESFDDIGGQQEVIATVIAFANNLSQKWAEIEGNYYGVWYYDICEPLGMWIVEQWATHGRCPSSAEVDEYITDLLTEARA